MFITINRKIHGSKDLLTTTLNTEEVSIPVISEQHQEPVRLYDEEGNLVSEEMPSTKFYRVVVVFKANGFHVDYLIDQTEYDKLVENLSKQAK